MSKIEKIQNLSIRTSCRYLQSTPIQVIYSEVGEFPLHYRAQYLAYKELLKTLYFETSPIVNHLKRLISSDEIPKHHSYLEKIASENNYHVLQCKIQSIKEISCHNNIVEIVPTIPNLNRKNTPLAVQKSTVLKLIREEYFTHFKIFTDGSKSNDGVGYGVYDQENRTSFSFKLNPNFSIMNAELAGIIEAIEYAISINQFKIVILTDSQSGCMALIDKNIENYLVQLFYSIVNCNNLQKVVIQWIPGHINIIGNDRADAAAKLGTNKSNVENYPLTISDSLISFRKELTDEWNKEYIRLSQEKGKEHYKIMKSVDRKPWFYKMDLNTTQTITLGRIRSFHTATKERLYKWNLIRTENCEYCDVQENLNHILYDCPRYSLTRRKYPVLDNKSDLISVLKTKKNDEYLQIAEFVREIGANV